MSFNLIDNHSRVLIISPHPDDEALGVGGLIGKAVKEKAKLFILYVTIGESRQLVTGKTSAKKRNEEIQKVIALTKAEVKIGFEAGEFLKLDLLAQKTLIDLFEDTISDFKPDIVAVPASNSYNQDHRAVYTAAIAALRPLPTTVRKGVDLVLEYTEPYEWAVSEGPRNNFFLDLTEKTNVGDLLDFKLKLYRCHQTQVRKDPFPRSIENLKRIAALTGKEVGIKAAEGYKVLRLKV